MQREAMQKEQNKIQCTQAISHEAAERKTTRQITQRKDELN